MIVLIDRVRVIKEPGRPQRAKRWVIQMDVKCQLVVTFRKPFAKLSLNRPVTGTDMILDDIANDEAHVLDISQLLRGPVMQELRALGNDVRELTAEAIMRARMECAMVKP